MKKIFLLSFLFLSFVALNSRAQNQAERNTYVYAIKGADTLHLDTYVDKSVPVTGKRPVMIYIHGGAWSAGSRKNAAQEVFNRHLASLGIFSVSIDYRKALEDNGNKYHPKDMDEIVQLGNEDLIDATNFLLKHATEWNLNSACVMLSGGSAGGINSLTIEHDICNGKAYTQRLPKDFNYGGIISHAGCILKDEGDTLTWKKTPCPMLLFHGSNDNCLPVDQDPSPNEIMKDLKWVGSLYIHRQLTQMDVPHWMFLEIGADHIIAMKCLTDNDYETDEFIKKIILGKQHSIVYTEWRDKEPKNMDGVENMVKYAPLYILGFGKYLDEIDWSNMQKPQDVVY